MADRRFGEREVLDSETQRLTELYLRRLYRNVEEIVGQELSRRYGHLLTEHAGLTNAGLPIHDHTAASGQGGALTAPLFDSYAEFSATAAPTSGAGVARLYARTSSGITKLYYLGDDGVEVGPLASGMAAVTAGHTIADEGSSLTQRTVLNFTGPGVLAADNSGSSRTDVTVNRWEPLANGSTSAPDLVFTPTGDVIMVERTS